VKDTERILAQSASQFDSDRSRFATNFRYMLAYLWAVKKLGTADYLARDLLKLSNERPTKDELLDLWKFAYAIHQEETAGLEFKAGKRLKKIFKHEPFIRSIAEKLTQPSGT